MLLVQKHSWNPHCFPSPEGLLWGAEPRFELRTALQQADTLLSEPHRTLVSHTAPCEPRRTLWATPPLWATPHPKSTPHPRATPQSSQSQRLSNWRILHSQWAPSLEYTSDDNLWPPIAKTLLSYHSHGYTYLTFPIKYSELSTQQRMQLLLGQPVQ